MENKRTPEQRALEVISKIASINNEDEENKVLNDIYIVSHAFSGTCGNPHDDWKEKMAALEKQLEDY